MDKIEKIDRSLVQHGKENDRLYLIKMDHTDYPEIITKVDAFSQEKSYGKIFAKVPTWAVQAFHQHRFIKEAFIPRFFRGHTGTYFMSKYLKKKRRQTSEDERQQIAEILRIARAKMQTDPDLPTVNFVFRVLGEYDCEALAELYQQVFPSYPFPIFDPDYLIETLRSHVIYFGAFLDDKLIAASSAETDPASANAEMTDFATLPDFRGHKLALHLLQRMEEEMQARSFKTLYTIARALSPGMNITFAKNGYNFGGTLINNTHIAGKIESMNVWYKRV
ncbi:MAG TPA: putative beta-lysine N-acetyltransferase [bacterium]|nr:putative beta-lysine N-acetyltransferase [bacterium]